MSITPDTAPALDLAQQNAANEIAKFLRTYVPPSLWKAALQDMKGIFRHYDATVDLLPIS